MNIEEENRVKNGFSVYCASTTKTMAVLQTGMEESEEKDDMYVGRMRKTKAQRLRTKDFYINLSNPSGCLL